MWEPVCRVRRPWCQAANDCEPDGAYRHPTYADWVKEILHHYPKVGPPIGSFPISMHHIMVTPTK